MTDTTPPSLTTTPSRFDFSGVHAAVRRHIDAGLIAGASHAVLLGQDLVDTGLQGHAVIEDGTAMRADHLFRIFSNTKLVTSIAVMQLWEQGRLGLDDPVEQHLPALGARQVLRPGATRIDDTEPARRPITVRHLLSHSSGLSYGVFDPGSLLFKAYAERKVHHPAQTLAQMVDALAPLPLAYHPGEGWEYSVATDVLGRVVEAVSGQAFGDYLQQHVFTPLGLRDTGFVVAPEQQHRLTGYYLGADLLQPLLPGLTRVDATQPFPGAYRQPMARQSGGGGLVSSLPDMVTLVRSLLPGGPALLKPETLALLRQDQLPAHVQQSFPNIGVLHGRGHGLGGGVIRRTSPLDHPAAAGEFYWGGVAGTQWFVHPGLNLAGVLMLQRVMGFTHPVGGDFKRSVYQAVAG